ncbi:threonine/serine exporter family protein [Microbacterium sp. UFMG61]|uniref:threonine/serine exporter family protein n=1 Tax=Microbacterium sp. UFMG61 TaxID=2745935 RepID=UPI00188E37F6|nr:threonine/serine exporter family protein [Microbacterium sp. UFMG61]
MRHDLIASASATLHASGESTSVTLAAVDRMNHGLDTDAELIPAWTSVTLAERGRSTGVATAPRIVLAPPTGIAMNAVSTLTRTIDKVGVGSATESDLAAALADARKMRPADIWLFLLACATGSAALAVIFGAQDATAVGLAAGSAVLGGVARRTLAHLHVGPIGQVFTAALIAGLIGGFAVHADLSSALRLIAVCPAMILVPGPHILNAALDLLSLRIPLGFARLGYAALLLLSIGTGLAIGLAAFGTGLPPTPPGREVALGLDVLAAGIAAASYPVYFAMPLRLIWWPVVVGAVAHGLRWVVMDVWGWNIAAGALVACLFVGFALAPVARATHIPFAGIGFAAVVSLVPGVYIFRTIDALGVLTFAGGSSPSLGALTDGATAVFVIMAMAAGLVIPMRFYELIRRRRAT